MSDELERIENIESEETSAATETAYDAEPANTEKTADTKDTPDAEPVTDAEIESTEEPAEAVLHDSTEDSSDTASSEDSGLTPEHIGHLLSVLGDDIIADMLESAGLTHEDLDALLEEEQGAEASGEAEDTSKAKKPKLRKPRRKGASKRRFLFLILFLLIVLSAAAIGKIFMSVTINTNDPIQYSEEVDEISANEGSLNVNNVSVTVPTDGTETYSISYSWSENDDKYPSVPHAITAIYSGEEGNKLYSISLYRNETIPKNQIKKGKKASNWFDDWAAVTEGDVLQTPVKSGDINGFYIFPQPADDGSSSEYNDYSYYFAVKDKNGGVSVYVIEGVCTDPERAVEFRNIMDNSIHSISIK